MSQKTCVLKTVCCSLHFFSPSFPPSCAGPHEGRDVSTVGFGVRLQLLAGTDAQRTVSTRNRQRVQQHTTEPAAAGGGHARKLQAPGLLGVHRDRWRRRKSVSMDVHRFRSHIREELFPCKQELVVFFFPLVSKHHSDRFFKKCFKHSLEQ